MFNAVSSHLMFNDFGVTKYNNKISNVETARSEQTVQTQIRLLLKEQSDQGLHCLPFHLHLLDALPHCKPFGCITAM